jgi:outer membrane protein insertion porin family
MFVPATKPARLIVSILLAVAFSFLFASCSVIVRKYPAAKPFVYKTDVQVEGKFTTDERKQLKAQLEQQLHDSLKPRTVQKWVFFNYMDNPPSYDSLNVGKSIIYLKALLNSAGYYHDTIIPQVRIDTVEDQYRTFIDFHVQPGRLTRLDSIWYGMNRDTVGARPGRDTLQQITLNARNESLLKKGEAFSKPVIAAERDRLADLYRNNGYLRFTSEEILAIWDTVDLALIRPTLDPIEQARLIEALRERRENPTADVEMTLRANRDTSHLIRYYNGNITIYPDVGRDTAEYVPQFQNIGELRIVTYFNRFKPKILAENVFMKKGDLYVQRNYLRTLNRFNALGAWRLVSIDQVPRPGTDTVDFNIKLTPAEKYKFSANLEGSRNVGQSVYFTGSLLGMGVNFNLQNRNFARVAGQANTSARFGTELGSSEGENLVQSVQAIFSHTITFPRLIPKGTWVPQALRENARTSLNFNVGNIDRIDVFNVSTFNASMGYEFNWKNKLLGIRFPNVEYNYLIPGPRLRKYIEENASFKYIFNTGLISSIIGNYTRAGAPRKNVTNVFRTSLELSGPITGYFRSPFLDKKLYRFARADVEFRNTHTIRRTAVVWRVFGGIGVGVPRFAKDSINFSLPFFRQYYAGGPNSMRAWGLRKLGPGSRIASLAIDEYPDRFGDIQLEGNFEYRFYVANFQGWIINSALFTDVGNVWFLRDDPTIENEEFRFNRLWHDLAIGAGTGLRLDLGFLKIRVDYAFKIKNPTLEVPGPQWFTDTKGQLQFGIDYPF